MPRSEYHMTEEERQAFRAYVVPDPICVESRGNRDTRVSQAMREKLETNDTFIIHGMGRLEYSTAKNPKKRELAESAKKFNIAILDVPVLNSRFGVGNELMRYIISDIMLQLNACIDRGKKEYLQQRVVNGIRAAKAKGIKVGRRPKERPAEFKHLKEEWKRGEVSSRDAAKTLGVSRATFLRWVRDE